MCVCRIDPGQYPQFAGDRDHTFASMSAEARIEEIDSFLARLWARAKRSGLRMGGLSAAG